MPWYRQGTVSITAGQTTVTGIGTNFAANSRVGDAFQGPDGRWYEVANIPSPTVLSILPAYQGATVVDGAYGLAPMQGYVKESADRLRQIVEQWGSTLAGLGTVSTEDVVPVGKGGTGGVTPADARAGLGLKSAAVADVLGVVSQVGGVPSGAIMQSGSNVNGSFVKYADGRLECRLPYPEELSLSVPVGGTALSGTYFFPHVFVAPPCVSYQGYATDGPGSNLALPLCDAAFGSVNYWRFALRNNSNSAVTRIVNLTMIAIGRWF